jgi:hypothetical protein
MSDLNILDYAESVKNRLSWGKFADKNGESVKAMKDARQKLLVELESVSKNNPEFAKLYNPARDTKTELAKIADLGKDGWVKKNGDITDEAFTAAKKAYNEAATKLEGVVSGKEVLKDATGAEVKLPETLKTSHEAATKAVGKVKSTMDHMFGMAKVEGMGFTAKHNLNKFNVFSKEARVVTSNKDLLIRGGSMGIGAVMTIDALARGKDKEGEPRGGYTRLLEGLAGLGLVGGGLLAGHAR